MCVRIKFQFVERFSSAIIYERKRSRHDVKIYKVNIFNIFICLLYLIYLIVSHIFNSHGNKVFFLLCRLSVKKQATFEFYSNFPREARSKRSQAIDQVRHL